MLLELCGRPFDFPRGRLWCWFRRRRKRCSRVCGLLGLGLFVVRQIIEDHEGTIEVHSTEGAGTTFVISLPALASLAPEDRSAEA